MAGGNSLAERREEAAHWLNEVRLAQVTASQEPTPHPAVQLPARTLPHRLVSHDVELPSPCRAT